MQPPVASTPRTPRRNRPPRKQAPTHQPPSLSLPDSPCVSTASEPPCAAPVPREERAAPQGPSEPKVYAYWRAGAASNVSPEPPLRSDPDERPEPTGEPAAEEGLSFEELLEIAKAAGYVPPADSPRVSQPTLDEMLEQRRAEERAALHHSLAGMYPDALADESLLHKLCVGAMGTLGPLDALMAILSARLVDDAADPARLLLRLEGLRKMSMVTRTLQQRVQSSLETAQLLRLRRRFDPTKVP